ncbi:MAG: DUF2971 domain-containing protein [Pontiella sp.]
MSSRLIPDILYHYCSVDTFQNIILSKVLWLSDLSKSNDSKEGKIAPERLGKWLQAKHNCSREECDFVYKLYEEWASRKHCLGTCFSNDGDLLSQWRGYGDDGRGIAIGFSSDWLSSLLAHPCEAPRKTAGLIPILYTEEDQYDPIEAHLDDLARTISEDVRNDNPRATNAYATIFTIGSEILYQYKDEFFKEELEWRIRCGTQGSKLLHRSINGKIIPYMEMPLHCEDLNHLNPISRLVLGPKNTVPEQIIKKLLESNGFKSDIRIERSKGSYQ